jgi:phage-related protein
MAWTVSFLDERVEAEMEAQPEDIQASFKRIALLVEEHGVLRLPRKLVDHIEGRLWELRMRGKDGIARALYVTASGPRVVVVRVFTKKTQKAPRSEIRLALQRAKEVA